MTQIKRILITSILHCFIAMGCTPSHVSPWILVDDFETDIKLEDWTHIDVQNETKPFVPDPQIAEVHLDDKTGNHYFLKKPAADGIIGNRKALGFKSLPQDIAVGEDL